MVNKGAILIQKDNISVTTENHKDTRTLTIRDMFDANWHFGEPQSNTHPSMNAYITRYEKRYALISLPEAKALMNDALEFITKVTSSGGKILITGKDPKMSELVENMAKEAGQFYVAGKWPGGLLTNWHKTFLPSMQSLKQKEIYLADPKVVAELTKREHLKQSKQLEKAKKAFAGVLEMGEQLPTVIVVISGKDVKAIDEASKYGIAIVGLCDTSTDARSIQYPVPGNTSSISTVKMFLDLVVAACKKGRAEYVVKQPEEKREHRFIRPRMDLPHRNIRQDGRRDFVRQNGTRQHRPEANKPTETKKPDSKTDTI